jgi:NADH-quinone oxidoreductase subunit J
MSLELIALVVLSLLVLVSAAVVVFHRNPVVCALALALNLVSIAGFYLLLNAQFLALLQVIVYAGAIMVLILFVIMLLNLPEEARRPRGGFFQKSLALVFSAALIVVLATALLRSSAGARYLEPSPEFGTVSALGTDLFTKFFYPFEAVSLLLIVAMIGAVLLAKRRL